MRLAHKLSVILVAAAIAAAAFMASQPAGKDALPRYAAVHPLVKEAYTFAAESPSRLDGINCYCGCMQHPHNGRIHSRGLLDCFITQPGGFDRHASECDMCINDALEAKKLSNEGKSKDEINAYIGSKYTL